MTLDEFQKALNRYDLSKLGLRLERFNETSRKSVVKPKDTIRSLIGHFKSDAISIRLKFIDSLNSMDMWVLKSSSEYFTVSEYLQFKNRHKQLPELEIKVGETPEQYISRFMDFAYELLKTDLLPIVQGKIWEEVPRDWMGYR